MINEKGEQQQLFKVRDLRKKDQFKIDDAYLNGYARICGKDATLVYTSLCRHAEFNSQKAFPSQNKIAYEHKISVKTVRRGLKKLIDYNIVMAKQERMGGKFVNYVYYLLDKSEWKEIPRDKRALRSDHRAEMVGRFTAYGVEPTKDNKEQRITNIKDNKIYNNDDFKNKKRYDEMKTVFKNKSSISYKDRTEVDEEVAMLQRAGLLKGPNKEEIRALKLEQENWKNASL